MFKDVMCVRCQRGNTSDLGLLVCVTLTCLSVKYCVLHYIILILCKYKPFWGHLGAQRYSGI